MSQRGNLPFSQPFAQRLLTTRDEARRIAANIAKLPDGFALGVHSQLDYGEGSCGFRRFARSAASLR